jgi:transposase-like protein
MPSKYKRDPGSRKYKDFSDESVQKAMDSVIRTKMSIRKAAEKYNITKSTLHRKLKGQNLNPHGGQTVLTVEEESMLVQGLLETAKCGLNLQKHDVCLLVQCYLDIIRRKETRFKNNMPGVDWVRNFLKRHQGELTVSLAQNMKCSWPAFFRQ